jgi:hypothetical protein
MEFSDIFTISLVQLLARTPILLFWIAVIIFGAVMLGRGGGRAERFLIAGAVIKIVVNVLAIPSPVISSWFIGEGRETADIITFSKGYSIVLGIISMAGMVCLVYAFWCRFRMRDVMKTNEKKA